jgi:hypothetical protein
MNPTEAKLEQIKAHFKEKPNSKGLAFDPPQGFKGDYDIELLLNLCEENGFYLGGHPQVVVVRKK